VGFGSEGVVASHPFYVTHTGGSKPLGPLRGSPTLPVWVSTGLSTPSDKRKAKTDQRLSKRAARESLKRKSQHHFQAPIVRGAATTTTARTATTGDTVRLPKRIGAEGANGSTGVHCIQQVAR